MFPKSIVNFKINLVGVLGFFAAAIFLIKYPLATPTASVIFLMLCWIIPVLILEAIFLPHVTKALTHRPNEINFRIAGVRYLGLLATLVPIAFLYWAFPEYHEPFYQTWWGLLKVGLPMLLILGFPYFLWLGPDIVEKEQDAYYQLGMFVLGNNHYLNKSCLVQHALGWLVKMFFLPLMIGYCWGTIQSLQNYTFANVIDSIRYCFNHLLHPSTIDYSSNFLSNNFAYLFNFCWALVFLLDLAGGCTGYALSFRIFDNQIRSTEPTLLGWFVALQCYAPFNTVFSSSFFAYGSDNYTWGNWLMKDDITYVIWGSIILLLCVIYVSATVAFGLRFSNLTNRGIVTDGPYRYLKHPAYLSKNLSWWMIAIPFISPTGHFTEAIRNMFMLGCVNFVYYLRAKTEERHLSRDPVYRQYLQAIDEHGLIAKLKRWLLPKSFTKPNLALNETISSTDNTA